MELENNLLLVSAIAVTLKQMSEGTPLTVVVLGLPRATPPSSTTYPAPSPATCSASSSTLLLPACSSCPQCLQNPLTCSERPGLQECL